MHYIVAALELAGFKKIQITVQNIFFFGTLFYKKVGDRIGKVRYLLGD